MRPGAPSRFYAVLRRHNAAFCIFELAGYHSEFTLTANFTYVRLHGPGGAYAGSYDREQAAAMGKANPRMEKELRAVYVYFDNDQAGYAAENARTLRDLVG